MARHGSCSYIMMGNKPVKSREISKLGNRRIMAGQDNSSLSDWYPMVYPDRKPNDGKQKGH